MKRLIFFLPCLFILVFCVNILHSEEKKENSAKDEVINLETSNLEYNIGNIGKGQIINRVIRIRNKLTEAIDISDARSTCDCVKLSVTPQIVEKGGIFEAEITFDDSGMDGDVQEVVYILTNNMKYELIRLVISAKIT
ncbi:MAG: DUF1573 domain-containing protein [Candidatus Omnitrophica bacterium]|nr:DUF1573 domain-containing protein [Candidatus Omnitrophota bacterium]MDD5352976.1 DUF1573 domain-containing protein [Candidatus Omnitrophota bacterium]MDD5550575.1 DUF1573 domain-containing protein [Candidatus Omnitrophota bacterium]